MNSAIPASTLIKENKNFKKNIYSSGINKSDNRQNSLNNAHIGKNLELSKNFLLDYTFLSHRSQLSQSNSKDPTKSKDYIFDLTNTWELNVELIENLLRSSPDTELLKIVENIKSKFIKKKGLRKDYANIKGKILIEKQIVDEFKRKIEENEEYYKEQMRESEENRENKEEYIKIFEKKLKEVEIYVQKNTKTNPKFEVYKDFKINEFIESNTDLMKRREVLEKEYYKSRENRDEIIRENADFKNDLNFSFTNEEKEDNNDKNNNVMNIYNDDICNIKKEDNKKLILKEKLNKYFESYRNQVRILEMRTKMLRNHFDKIKMRMKQFNCDIEKCKNFNHNILGRKKKNPNYDIEDKEERNVDEIDSPTHDNMNNILNDKSGINLDMTKKMATFMDFSIILNKKNQNDDTQIDFGLNKTGLGRVNNDMWDISKI